MSAKGPPSPNGANGGRDGRGRFAKGNPGGPGAPMAAAVGRLRAELVRAVSPADIRQIAQALIRSAKRGDVFATKTLLAYLLGPPVEVDLIARLEAVEARLTETSTGGTL